MRIFGKRSSKVTDLSSAMDAVEVLTAKGMTLPAAVAEVVCDADEATVRQILAGYYLARAEGIL